MAAPGAVAFNDIMDHEDSFMTILEAFGLSNTAAQRFTDDFATARNIISVSSQDIKDVIHSINKTYRHHRTANLRCYIKASQQNHILAFRKWATFAIRDAQARYDVNTVGEFDLDWITSICEEYMLDDPEPTSQSTALSVSVSKFDGTNWYEVKSQFVALVSTRIGQAGLPLSYLIRKVRKSWEDSEEITSLQERRMATKLHEGTTFEVDNRELYRILLQTFASTTLEDTIKTEQRSQSGTAAWAKVINNVEGASFHSELKREADALISKVYFDPNRAFTFSQYFAVHTKAHEMFAAANAPVAEWKKIEDFMKGIRCSALHNDYRMIKDRPEYVESFTAFYNKLNENFRMLCQQGIVKPANPNKRRISELGTDYSSRGHGRGRGRGRGRGGRFNRGSGRGGRGFGRGRGRGRNGNASQVDLSCLPKNLDLNNLSFEDATWWGFTQHQRDAINALRQMRNNARQTQSTTSTSNQDDVSSIGNNSQRFVYEINVPTPTLPPPPATTEPIQPPSSNNSSKNAKHSTSASNAGQAFGRRSN